ncbi:CoA-transferase subunit beta [Pseudomonas citronellolis]|uniref:CoA-transferase subunit beta n=1 Tax=Pseudomonas citronellolis TaxID=53408 RepID=UPI0021BEF8F6|nr:ketoacid CoA transferase [Pseudomonas citronellolis]UXJ55131.1 ketoacid CoA transferase [Pseudomonas citronellolis]
MTDANASYSLAELLISTASECWRDDGEVLATGIGVIPRLAASLAMQSCNRDLLMTDSEAFMVGEPVPLGARNGYQPKFDSWMGFSRIFDNVWGGRRHALVGPTQVDRFGQANISCIGDYARPKAQMLGVRGFPGNSISHANSFFVPAHSRRVFVEGEVDMVASVGYNPARLARGWTLDDIDIRLVVTDLCVLDFQGPQRQMRVRSLHPGVELAQVLDNTGFDLALPARIPTTAAPTAQQLELIRRLDPHNLRARQLKDDPPGDRRAAGARP